MNKLYLGLVDDIDLENRLCHRPFGISLIELSEDKIVDREFKIVIDTVKSIHDPVDTYDICAYGIYSSLDGNSNCLFVQELKQPMSIPAGESVLFTLPVIEIQHLLYDLPVHSENRIILDSNYKHGNN